MKRSRLLRGLIAGLTSLCVIGVASVAFAYPAATAALCPECYGFSPLEGRAFIEREASPEARAAAQAVIQAAQARVDAFYGEVEARPRVLICTSEDCYRRLGGGGSRGMTLVDRALILSPRGTDPVIAAHELAHAALHARLGLRRTWQRAIPQWFDEGLAVVVSEDPRYLAAEGSPDRCRIVPDGPMPEDRAAWIERAASEALYAKAACRVSRWLAGQVGREAALRQISLWAAGAPFEVPDH